jgi:Fe-Mn family superoxide dismutase
MQNNQNGKIPSELENKINEDLGSVESMKEEFINNGIGQFGSGWCWLVLDNDKLKVTKTPNAENPIVHGQKPLLGCDVWEHSYYVDYKNRRPDYLKSFIDNLVNWEKVTENLLKSL